MINEHRLIHLRSLREYELKLVLSYLPTSSRILEIGAGAGWQAKQMAEQGHEVIALDVNDSRLGNHRVYPIQYFDGINIPFPDKSFDVVYSSNVLEHIVDLQSFERELFRVLKQDGTVIHVLPTAHWRFWTSLTHPIYLLQLAYRLLLNISKNTSPQKLNGIANPSVLHVLRHIFPRKHGARGNAITEMLIFSNRQWSHHFNASEFNVISMHPIELFYTGNQIFHRRIDLIWRRRLAHFLGSATLIWIMKKIEN